MADKKPLADVLEVYRKDENGVPVMCIDPVLLAELENDGHIVIVPTEKMYECHLVERNCSLAVVPRKWFKGTPAGDWVDNPDYWQEAA